MNRTMITICLTFLFLNSGYLFGSDRQEWVKHYDLAKSGNYTGSVLKIDNENKVIIAGNRVDGGDSEEIVVVKYDSKGSQLWEKSYTGDGFENEVNAMNLDVDGNIYLAGSSSNRNDYADMITLKIDPMGEILWQARFDGSGHFDDEANAIAVDSVGNVYVAGSSTAPLWDLMPNMTTIKYNSLGRQQWVAEYKVYNHYSEANAIAIDLDDNIIVTGTKHSSKTQNDIITCKYGGNSGAELWHVEHDGGVGWNDLGYYVRVDSQNEIIVAGITSINKNDADIGVIKYNTNGQQLWAIEYANSESEQDEPAGLVVDAFDNIYVTGTLNSSLLNPKSDIVTLSLNPDGVEQWAAIYNCPAEKWDYAGAIALDAFGNTFVTGNSIGENDRASTVTLKYDPKGDELWQESFSYTETSDDNGNDVAVDADGNICVLGTSGEGLKKSYITTIKYQDEKGANPVELSAFDAELKDDKINLTWKTESEVNSLGFRIERMAVINEDILPWQQVEFVRSTGTTNKTTYYNYLDTFPYDAASVQYRLVQVDIDGSVAYSDNVIINIKSPKAFSLDQNYPNPFNAQTKIRFRLPVESHITLNIFDSQGKLVQQIMDESVAAGYYEKNWNADDFASGVYFGHLKADKFSQMIKLLLIK